jgi:cell division transport system permease protein
MRAGFVFDEVRVGLRRNLTMTIAVVVTLAVSLGLFGTGLLVRAQVQSMKDFWYDRVQVSIFLCGEDSEVPSCAEGAVTASQRNQIRKDLEEIKPLVEEIYYESQADAFKRFREQFRDSPILENVTQEALPESFRVKLSDPEQYEVVASAFRGRPGIEVVQDQRRLLDSFFKVLAGLQAIALGISVAMLLVTVLLVTNTMRVAAYSRRRETGIMRLVGASNWYIQLPFLVEAAVAALIGASLAAAGLAGLKHFVIDQRLAPTFRFTAFITWDDLLAVLPIIFGAGILLAVLAAFITLRKYLRV